MKFEFVAEEGELSRVARFAFTEAQKYIADAALSEDAPSSMKLMLCGCDDPNAAVELVDDTFHFELCDQAICVKACRPRGLLNGVYELLHLLGYRFPFPGIDRRPEVFDWANLKECCSKSQQNTPSFRHRILHFDNLRLTPEMVDWIGKLRINMIQEPLHVFNKDIGIKQDLVDMLQDRGIELNIGCHGFDNWLPPKRYAKEHPEWYGTSHAARRGEILEHDDAVMPAEFVTGQLCLSNHEMTLEFAANMVGFLKEHPEVRTVSIWPNDMAGGWCTCQSCLALEADPDRIDPQAGTPSRSATYLHFINQVGRFVHSQIPEARIEFAAFYGFASPPENPEVVPQENHYLGFLIDDYFGCLLHGHGESWNRDRIQDFHNEWRRVFSGEIYAVGYYTDLAKVMDMPIVFASKIRSDFAYLKDEIGIESVSTLVVCAELHYLLDFTFQNIFSYAALAWDHRRTSESILRELAEAICPENSAALHEYFSNWDSLGAAHPDKHGGWIWIEPDPELDSSPWASVISVLRVDELVDEETFTRLKVPLQEVMSGSDYSSVSREVLRRISSGFNVFEKLYTFNPKASAEERLTSLAEIKDLVCKRKFPAGILPLLDRWEGDARKALEDS